jgi:hypothetical protein
MKHEGLHNLSCPLWQLLKQYRRHAVVHFSRKLLHVWRLSGDGLNPAREDADHVI